MYRWTRSAREEFSGFAGQPRVGEVGGDQGAEQLDARLGHQFGRSGLVEHVAAAE